MDRDLQLASVISLGIGMLMAFDITANTAVDELFSESRESKRQRLKERVGELPYMKNLSFRYWNGPQAPLVYQDRYARLIADPGRQYCKKLTHLFDWEILDLAELMKVEIERPRSTSWRPRPSNPQGSKRGRPTKADYLSRLCMVLEWLGSGESGDRAELEYGISKTSIVEDKKHILKAINKVLQDQISWPDAEERSELCTNYLGIFAGVVGILDCTEHFVEKSSDQALENATFSGKANANTYKTLAVIDKTGLFRYMETMVVGKRNDRDMWTSCKLYLERGFYFSEDQCVAADGGFQGDGPIIYSFDDLTDETRALYNLAFKETRVGVENAFGRVQLWFPILGVLLREWTYDDELLELAIGASFKLHNWILKNRRLNYDAQNNPLNHFNHLA